MIQTIDFRFEILFLLGVLISIICLVVALVLAVSSQRSAAKRLLRVLGAGWVGYLCIVFFIAAATPQRVVPMNQDLCWDEMCFAVVNTRRLPQLDRGIQPARANDIFYVRHSAGEQPRSRSATE
jgi:hypothetical protein